MYALKYIVAHTLTLDENLKTRPLRPDSSRQNYEVGGHLALPQTSLIQGTHGQMFFFCHIHTHTHIQIWSSVLTSVYGTGVSVNNSLIVSIVSVFSLLFCLALLLEL